MANQGAYQVQLTTLIGKLKNDYPYAPESKIVDVASRFVQGQTTGETINIAQELKDYASILPDIEQGENKYTFCHLHRHCEASIQDGVGKVEDGVKYAKKMGHPAVAVTDHGNLISYVRLQNEAQIQGIKHIFGLEAYLCDDMKVKDKDHRDYNHCTILVKNQQGLKNILALNNISQSEGFYYKPRLDWDTLLRHKEGLIILSGCVIGRTCQYILSKRYSDAEDWTRMMRAEMGEDYYMELMVSDFPVQKECNKFILELSRKYNIPGVITGDAHYTRKEDYQAQKAMMLLSSKATIQQLEEQQRRKAERANTDQSQEEKDKIWIFDSDQYWMKNEKEMMEAWALWHQDYYPLNEFESHLNESGKIADKIDIVKLDDSYKMPKADLEGEVDHNEFFRKKLQKGMEEKGFADKKEYVDQLANEVDIISQKGLIDYFLVTSDIIKWTKENGIFVGPGRGSAGGSLVCYVLGITDIDPLQHGLLFERFLDLGRQEMPDIDTDFEIQERDKVKQYISERYGKDHVASVSAFGTFRARNIIRDIARVYGHEPQVINEIAKAIAEDCEFIDGTLYRMDEEFHSPIVDEFFQKNPQIKDIASTLFGQIRHVSKHAAGVVITDRPLSECVPTISVGGEIMTAWSEGLYRKELSQLNFLKLDILGLKTLSIIKLACQLAKIDYRKLISLDVNDSKVYKLINDNKLISGIFQFDSSTGSWLFNHMKPQNFNDLVALGALDRPGPLDSFMAFEYIDRMHGAKVEDWQHPTINEVLKETYGVIVYQEQLMTLSKKLSGFSALEASSLRKNLVKGQHSDEAKIKQEKERNKIHEHFINGAMQNGTSKEEANKLWNAMIKFARYGFNKAHAVGYAYITYWTMWLKLYYPLQFYTAMLTHVAEEDVPSILAEMKRLGIELDCPDINKSGMGFTSDEDRRKVLFGLGKVKFLGTKAQEAIIANRPYTSFEDLNTRVPKSVLNRRAKEALIRSGAFNLLEEDKGKLLKLLEYEGLSKKQKQLFDMTPEFISYDQTVKDQMFYLGVALSEDIKVYSRGSHVAGMYRQYKAVRDANKIDTMSAKFEKNIGEYTFPDTGLQIERFCGYIQTIKVMQSKSGHEMIALNLETYQGEVMKFFIMKWDKIYKQALVLKDEDPIGIAIFKRKIKGEFPKIHSIFKFTQ